MPSGSAHDLGRSRSPRNAECRRKYINRMTRLRVRFPSAPPNFTTPSSWGRSSMVERESFAPSLSVFLGGLGRSSRWRRPPKTEVEASEDGRMQMEVHFLCTKTNAFHQPSSIFLGGLCRCPCLRSEGATGSTECYAGLHRTAHHSKNVSRISRPCCSLLRRRAR